MTAGSDPTREPRRDRYGRYLIEGVAHTRVTTIAKTLANQEGLTKWKLRMAVHGLARREDLIALAATSDPEANKAQLDRIADDALKAAKSETGANLGTALHAATEAVDDGDECPPLPGDLGDRVELYRATIERAGIRFDTAHTEQIVTLPDWAGDGSVEPIAGTLDRIAILPDGRRMVADIKTAKTLDYSWQEIAMQLACYQAHDRTYDPVTDRLGPRIPDLDPDWGLVIHLPSRSEAPACRLYLVDIGAGLEAFDYALWVRDWRRRKDLSEPYEPTPAPPVENPSPSARVDWVRWRITNLKPEPRAVTALRHRWPAVVPKPLPDELTADQIGALAAVLDDIEARHGLPLHPYTNPPGTINTKEKPK